MTIHIHRMGELKVETQKRRLWFDSNGLEVFKFSFSSSWTPLMSSRAKLIQQSNGSELEMRCWIISSCCLNNHWIISHPSIPQWTSLWFCFPSTFPFVRTFILLRFIFSHLNGNLSVDNIHLSITRKTDDLVYLKFVILVNFVITKL